MATLKHLDLLDDLNFVQLQELVEAARKRMEELRATGVQKLAEQFDAMAEAEYGVTASTLLALSRKCQKAGNGADHQS